MSDIAQVESTDAQPVTPEPSPAPEAAAEVSHDQWASAFEKAKAALDGADGVSTGEESKPPADPAGSGGGDDSEGAGDRSQATTEQAQPDKSFNNLQSALDHAQALIRAGREDELTPEERGALKRFRDDIAGGEREAGRQAYEREQAELREFEKLFRELHDLRVNDTDLFNAKVVEEPEVAAFYKYALQNYPEWAGQGARTYSKGEYDEAVGRNRVELGNEYRQAIEEALGDIARQHGVNYQEVRQKAGGKIGAVIAASIEAIAKAAGEKAVADATPGIAAAERKAAEQEATSRWLGTRTVSPRGLASTGEPGKHIGPIGTFEEAAAEAKKLLAAS